MLWVLFNKSICHELPLLPSGSHVFCAVAISVSDTVSWFLLSIPKDKPTISLNPTGLDLPQPQFSIRDTLRFGRMGVLTPWGVLTFGGRSGTAHYLDPPVVWRVRDPCLCAQ